MSKKDDILEMFNGGASVKEIATAVGCRTEYVRAVRCRYVYGHWQAEKKRAAERRRTRYRTDAAFREARKARRNERGRERYQTDPAYRERKLELSREWSRKKRRRERELEAT